MIGHINLGMKRAGERSAGNPPAAFDEEGAGNVMQPDEGCTGAPVFDPTDEGDVETGIADLGNKRHRLVATSRPTENAS